MVLVSSEEIMMNDVTISNACLWVLAWVVGTATLAGIVYTIVQIVL